MNSCNSLTEFDSILENILKTKKSSIKIGRIGGRYFEDENKKLFNLNQIVDCFHSLWPKTNKEINLRPKILEKIKQIDQKSSKKLKKTPLSITGLYPFLRLNFHSICTSSLKI